MNTTWQKAISDAVKEYKIGDTIKKNKEIGVIKDISRIGLFVLWSNKTSGWIEYRLLRDYGAIVLSESNKEKL